MKIYITKATGKKASFKSGMMRDTNSNKARFDLVIPNNQSYTDTLLHRWSALLSRGAEKYGERNWEKANSRKELNRFRESAFRHMVQWFIESTDDNEDHAAGIIFNVNGAESVKLKLAKRNKSRSKHNQSKTKSRREEYW